MIENFDDNTLSKALGFKIPTNNLKQTLTSISNEPLKTVILHQDFSLKFIFRKFSLTYKTIKALIQQNSKK